MQNYRPFSPSIDSSAQNRRENHLNQTFLQKNFDSNNNFNDFSKRSGFVQTLSPNNQSIPYENQIRKYSDWKTVSKPYPYSRGSTNREQSVYSTQPPHPVDAKFSDRHLKPDWNQFEDTIDDSLNEENSYYPNQQKIKSEEKRDDNTDSNDDTYNNEDIENEYTTDLDVNDNETTEDNEINDLDIDEEEERDREEDELDKHKYRR